MRANINAADSDISERSSVHDGGTFRVREFGNGAAVVFLTGGPGFAGEQFLSTARAQAGEHLAIVPDQRGTGGSTVETYDPTKFTIDQAVADLEALRVALDVERWSLVGHSWGSLLSMAYAAEHPDRVRSLALVSPAGIDSSFWQSYQGNLMQRVAPESMVTLQTLRPAGQTPEAMGDYYREINKILAPASIADPDSHPETVAALQNEMAEGMNPMVSLSMQPSLMQFDLRPKLAEFSAPTIFIQQAEVSTQV